MTTQPIRRPLARVRAAELGRDDGPTDGQLLARFVEDRDEAALAALVRRLGPAVLGVCRRVVGDAHLAEDAFQATFLVLVRRAAAIRPREQVGGWVYGVAYRVARRARATRARQLAKEQPVSALTPPATEPQERPDDLLPVLDEELARLPEHYRAAVLACDLEGRTRKDAARWLGIPEGTLSNRLAAARRMLARRLTRRGVTLGLAALLHASATARVSAALADATARFAAGPGSSGAASLAEGELKMLLLAKLKGLAVAMLAAVLGLGVAASALPAAGAGGDPSRTLPAVVTTRAAVRPSAEKPADPPAPKVIDYDGPIDAVAFSSDGSLLAVQARIDSGEGDTPLRYKDHTIKVWDVKTGKLVQTLLKEGLSSGVAFAPAGKSVAAIVTKIDGKETTNEVRIWGLADKTETTLAGSKAGWLYEVVFSPDGKYLAAGGVIFDETGRATGGEVIVWEVAFGNVLWENRDHKDAVRRLAFSADSKRLVTPSDDKTVRVWDAFTGKHLKTLPCPEEHWYSAAFSPDGKLIATGGADGAWVWDAETGNLKETFKGYKLGSILVVKFLPDGTLLTGGTPAKADGNLKLWNVQTGKLVREIPDPNLTFRSMDVSPDGKTAAVGTWDKTLFLVPLGK
jgi:RNA polymerase sigma factor (sigma-70 family)